MRESFGLLPVQRHLLLAQEWGRRLALGNITRPDLANEHGCSRPRVTQILNLLQLCAQVQELVLAADPMEVGVHGVTERKLRKILCLPPQSQVEAVQSWLRQASCGAGLRRQRFERGKHSGRG